MLESGLESDTIDPQDCICVIVALICEIGFNFGASLREEGNL